MILYRENPKDATRNLVELINEFSKVAGYKTNTQKSLDFYTVTSKDQKQKLRGKKSSHRGTAEMNPTRNHEVTDSIPCLPQWVKDPALLLAVV